MKMKYLIAAFFLTCSFQAFTQHTVVMKNGEKITGELQGIANNTVTFFHKGNNLTFHVGEITAVYFDDKGVSQPHQGGTPTGAKGISFVMPGRKLVKQPKVDNLTMEKGIVVVAITINKYGNIVKAEPGTEGTTTTSKYLHTKAKQAAESAMFDGGTTMPLEQQGTITITF